MHPATYAATCSVDGCMLRVCTPAQGGCRRVIYVFCTNPGCAVSSSHPHTRTLPRRSEMLGVLIRIGTTLTRSPLSVNYRNARQVETWRQSNFISFILYRKLNNINLNIWSFPLLKNNSDFRVIILCYFFFKFLLVCR